MRPLKIPPTRSQVVTLLESCVREGARSILLKVPNRPAVRVDGTWQPLHFDPLDAPDTRALLATLLELAGEPPLVPSARVARFAVSLDGLGRFPVWAVRQRGSWVISIRRVTSEPPSLLGLGLDGRVVRALDGRAGVLLVGGGRRRLDLLGALVRQLAGTSAAHVVTVEEPMVWLQRDQRAFVSQLEVGIDVPSVRAGLRAAARLDADAWMVTDVPGAAEAMALVRAAEDGALVLAGVAGPADVSPDAALLRRMDARERAVWGPRLGQLLLGVARVPPLGEVLWGGPTIPTDGSWMPAPN